LLYHKPKITLAHAGKHVVFKANVQEVTFTTRFFLSHPDYILMTRFSMEHKNKTEGMRKWREEQEEKKKSIKKDEIH